MSRWYDGPKDVTELYAPDDLWESMSSGDLVLLVEPGRNIYPLGPAIVKFEQHGVISIDILRTSNCKLRDIPLSDLALSGARDTGDLLSRLRERVPYMDLDLEITIVRFNIDRGRVEG